MYLFDLKNILKKLDSRLYVADSLGRLVDGHRLTGIYLKDNQRRKMRSSSYARHYASAKQRQYLEDLELGSRDKYICGTALDHIPEYDIFSLETGKLKCLGWRSIACILVKKNLGSWSRVRKLFRCNSLGETDYDRLNYKGKLELIRKHTDA